LQGGWQIYDIYLPDDGLEKEYNKNAERIIVECRGWHTLAWRISATVSIYNLDELDTTNIAFMKFHHPSR
jgi:hypothetical protein